MKWIGPIVCALALAACSAGPPKIAVTDAWARETRPGQSNGAVYLTISNGGGSDDRLVTAATEVASSAQIHESRNDEGVMRMRHLADGLGVPASETVTLAPNGTHVMLMGMREPLRAGGSLELRLTFERSGEQRVRVAVVDALAESHAGHSAQ